MITAITFHAIQRLGERRNVEHLKRHINKIQKWNLPDDGITEHNGYRYVTRDGVLVTVLPPSRKWQKENRAKELEHYIIKYIVLYPSLLEVENG